MLNWIYYQIAMYYLRKAHSVPVGNADLWAYYIRLSHYWISKVKT